MPTTLPDDPEYWEVTDRHYWIEACGFDEDSAFIVSTKQWEALDMNAALELRDQINVSLGYRQWDATDGEYEEIHSKHEELAEEFKAFMNTKFRIDRK